MKIAANLEMLGQGQIKFFRPEVLAADPAEASLFEARGWWNTTEKVLKFFDGTKVIEIAIGGDLNDYVRHDGTVAMTNDLLLSSADQSASVANAAVSKGYVAGLLAQKQDTVTGAATTIVAADLARSKALASDANGKVAAAEASVAELNYLVGVTAGVQSQIDSKQDELGYTPLNKAGDSLEGDLAAQGHKITGLGAPVSPTDAVRLADLEASVAGLNWQQDVDGIQVDDTLAPQKVEGARYVVTDAAHLHADFGTITGVANGDIVEYIGGAFVVAFDVSADAKADGAIAWNSDTKTYVRYVEGVWAAFGGLDSLVAGVGLRKTGNVVDVNLGAGIAQLPTDEVGIDVSATGGLALTLNGVESTDTDAKLGIKLDGETLAVGAHGLKVKASGIGEVEIAADALGLGLQGGDGVTLSVKAKSQGGVVVDAEGLSVDLVKLAETFLKETGDTAADLKVTAAPFADTDVVRLKELKDLETSLDQDVTALTTRFNASEVQYDGSANVATQHTIVHNLNNPLPQVEVTDLNGESVMVDSITRPNANTVVISVLPATAIKAVVRGNKN